MAAADEIAAATPVVAVAVGVGGATGGSVWSRETQDGRSPLAVPGSSARVSSPGNGAGTAGAAGAAAEGTARAGAGDAAAAVAGGVVGFWAAAATAGAFEVAVVTGSVGGAIGAVGAAGRDALATDASARRQSITRRYGLYSGYTL